MQIQLQSKYSQHLLRMSYERMFKIEAKKCFKIRKALVHAYQVSD